MALLTAIGFRFPMLKGDVFPPAGFAGRLPFFRASLRKPGNLVLPSSAGYSKSRLLSPQMRGRVCNLVRVFQTPKEAESSDASSCSDEEVDVDEDTDLMDDEKREEWRRKIREVIHASPDVEEESDPEEKRKKMQKLLAEYALVVEEDDPDWPEDADGWGFNFDQFFNKITIKNVKKDDDDEEDCDEEIVWQDDDYIRPVRDVTTREWEDTVFKDFNPLVILVHNRYKRPRENERARSELERAVRMFWESGLPSPRCAAVDAVVEQDLVSALKVKIYPEVIFTKAGKILHRDKVVRTADEWSKMMAFFYYRAARPSWLDKKVGQSQEKIPFLS